MTKTIQLTTALIVLFSVNIGYANIHYGYSGSKITVGITNTENGQEASLRLFDENIAFTQLNQQDVSMVKDSNNVYTIPAIGYYQNSGLFHFAKISDANVYFGDWAKTTDKNDITHQTYYIGKDVTTTLPANNASYSMTGISQYNSNNLLSGTFNVDFAQKKVDGALANLSRAVVLTNGNLYDYNNQITFSADAKENTQYGVMEGAFFGDNAEVLAGIIIFSSNHTKDIAFGGRKIID